MASDRLEVLIPEPRQTIPLIESQPGSRNDPARRERLKVFHHVPRAVCRVLRATPEVWPTLGTSPIAGPRIGPSRDRSCERCQPS